MNQSFFKSILCATVFLFTSIATLAQNVLPAGASPTALTVTNTTNSTVYANVVLGQPPTTMPKGCTNLGTQISSLSDKNLVFVSSVTNKPISFTLVPSVTDKGSYKMAAGETISYQPQTFSCGTSTCSPAVTLNFFFTPTDVGFTNNNGCSNSTFPNATNLAETSLNFGINGSVGSSCANADDTDISAVNGVNSMLSVSTMNGASPYPGWPANTSFAQNKVLGQNANLPGVFGWAATNCSGSLANSGYPNPSPSCNAPINAPRAVNGVCTIPGGGTYPAIVGPNNTLYCDERSNSGTCNNQRAAYTTGGNVAISYNGPAAVVSPVDMNAGPIWSNQDAPSKCPTVCSNAGLKWNGQWRTTVEGVMSVCGCAVVQ